jgi:uncharacterized membrane protein
VNLNANQRQIEKAIRSEVPGLLAGLSTEKKLQLIQFLEGRMGDHAFVRGPDDQDVASMQAQVTSSPVPPAELLEGYNAAIQDGAQRLFALVETQSDHRQKIEIKVVDGQSKRSDRGQIFAFILALSFGGVAVYFATIGQAVLAGTVLTTTIGGIVTTFLLGQKNQQRNLDLKDPTRAANPNQLRS